MVFDALTLDDVGDHESGTGVVADEATAGEVTFNLQGEQIPGVRRREKGDEIHRGESERDKRDGRKGEG